MDFRSLLSTLALCHTGVQQARTAQLKSYFWVSILNGESVSKAADASGGGVERTMEDARRPRGLCFEEFEVGTEMTSPGRTVTEADVTAFAGLSGDYNQLHTDAEFAKGSPFGARIAHGLLGLSMASGLASRIGLLEGTALAFMGLNWKFKVPIMIGDTISLRIRVSKKREASQMGGGIIILNMRLLNQRNEIAQEGSWTILVRSCPST